MAKYALFFSYTPEAWAKMIQNPSDRAATTRALIEPMGGKLESFYFMFGERDGLVIAELPDADAIAAVAIAVTSTGAFRTVQTHELIDPERLIDVLGKAATALGVYQAPGT